MALKSTDKDLLSNSAMLLKLKLAFLQSPEDQTTITLFEEFRREGGEITEFLLNKYEKALERQSQVYKEEEDNAGKESAQENMNHNNNRNNSDLVWHTLEGGTGNHININIAPPEIEKPVPQRPALWEMGTGAQRCVEIAIAAVYGILTLATPIETAKANVFQCGANVLSAGAHFMGRSWAESFGLGWFWKARPRGKQPEKEPGKN